MERSDLTKTLLKFFKILPLKSTTRECGTELIPQEQFFYYSLIPTAFTVAVLALLQRRRWKWFHILDGRPGVPCPINFLECRDNRLAYVAAFGLTSWTVWDAFTGSIPFKWSDENRFVRNLARLSACLMSALICYPIFGSIASDHVIGYAVGALYIWLYSIVYFLSNYPCTTGGQFVLAVDLLQTMPVLISMVYLCFHLPWQFWKRVTRGWRLGNGPPVEVEHSQWTKDFENSYAYQYVRELLAANRIEAIASRKQVLEIARRKRYKNIPGFRYSLSVLVAVLVSIQFVYVGTLDMIKFYRSFINHLHTPLTSSTNQSEPFMENLMSNDVALGEKSFLNEYHIWLDAFEVSVYVSIALAFLSTVAGLMLTLRGYRWHLLLLYRGQRLPMIPTVPQTAKPNYIVASAAKYVGFQFGYAIWGFVYQSALLLVTCFGLSALYLACFHYGKLRPIMRSIFDVVGPVAVYFFGLLVVQRVLVRLFFLQRDEKGRLVLAFDNRRLLWNFQYFMVFANSTRGIISCFLRIFKAILIGAWTLPRLDVSMMSRHYERFDNGYAAYAALLAVESSHTNPVMITFTKLLLLLPHLSNCRSSEELSCELIKQNVRLKSTRSKTVRNRWHLYLTLHHNPGLRLWRKEAIKIIRLMHAEQVILDDTLIEAPRLRLLSISKRLGEC